MTGKKQNPLIIAVVVILIVIIIGVVFILLQIGFNSTVGTALSETAS